jgi:hypothetical protein
MKKFISNFCFRGLIAMGFGPIVYGTIMLILHLCNVDTTSNGLDIFKGIISTCIMAFIIAGVSNIYQVESLSLVSKIMIHALSLYLVYLVFYLLNDWIIKDLKVIGIFSLIFFSGYIVIWVIIYIIERKKIKELNEKLKKKSI